MAAAPLWPYSAGILFLICKSEKSADFSDLLFHGRGRNGNRHMLLSACGRRAATPNRRNSKNALSEALAFLHFDLSFGVERGEQPLSRGSSASKSLALFWFSFGVKREHLSAEKFFIKAIKPALRENALAGSVISSPASSDCGSPAGCAAAPCSLRPEPARWGCEPPARSRRSRRRCAGPAS